MKKMTINCRFFGFRVRRAYISLRVGTREHGALLKVSRKGDEIGSYLNLRWGVASWMIG